MLEISKLSALLSHTTCSISPFFKMSETEKKKKRRKKKEKKNLFEAPYVASHSRSGSCLFFFEHLTDVLMLSAVFLFPVGRVAAVSTGRAVRGPGVLPSTFPLLMALAGTQAEISRMVFALWRGWELNHGEESTCSCVRI